MASLFDRILDAYPEQWFLRANGFDEAIIGVDETGMRLVYSANVCIEILMEKGLEEMDAVAYFEQYMLNAELGLEGPLFIQTEF
jgi:hypothetical protein